jgi:hypothetical protein
VGKLKTFSEAGRTSGGWHKRKTCGETAPERKPHVKRGAKYLSTRLETGLAPILGGGKCPKHLWDVRFASQAFISFKAQIVASVLNEVWFKAELKYGLNSYYWEFEQWQKAKTY